MVDHALLTRFNLPSQGAAGVIRASDAWLSTRVELFERYCLPSVRSQTCRDFGWLVYFDPESPDWLRRLIEGWSADGLMRPVFRASVTNAELMADISTYVGRTGDTLITSNVDNDDALATDFIARLQGIDVAAPRTALYLGNGLIRRGHAVYSHRDPGNAFCSVREPWPDARTCWSDWHNLLHLEMPVQVAGGAPGWLQVVHGGNVSNRVRGRLVSPAPYRSLFPVGLESATEPGRSAIVADALLGGPSRLLRDTGRQAVKAVVMGMAGKSGIERAHMIRQRLRRRSRRIAR